MEKFKVTVYFTPQEIVVTAKNKAEAKQKAYAKLEKATALKFVEKKETDVY